MIYGFVEQCFQLWILLSSLNYCWNNRQAKGLLNTHRISLVTGERAWLMFLWGSREVSSLKTWLWKHCTGWPIIEWHWGMGDIEVGWCSLISKGLIWEVLYNRTAVGGGGGASNPKQVSGSAVITIIVVTRDLGRVNTNVRPNFEEDKWYDRWRRTSQEQITAAQLGDDDSRNRNLGNSRC